MGGWAAAGKVSGHEKFYEIRTGQIGQALEMPLLGKGMVGWCCAWLGFALLVDSVLLGREWNAMLWLWLWL